MKYGCSRLVTHHELFVPEPQGLRDILRGMRPASLQEKERVRVAVCYAVWEIEIALEPHGGLHHLWVREGPPHLGGVTEFIGETRDG